MRILNLVFYFISAAVFGSAVVQCAIRTRQTNEIVPQNNATTDLQKMIAGGITKLALSLDYILTKYGNKHGNLIFAPVNILKTIGILMLGTGGTTEKEIKRLLGLAIDNRSNIRTNVLHMEIGKLLNKITIQDPGTDFGTNIDIAGGVFVQKDYGISSKYLQNAQDIYRTEVYNLEFAKDGLGAAEFINNWVHERTHGRIKEIIEPPTDPLTKLVVAGALFFNGDWEYPFILKATKLQPFYLGAEGKFSKESIQVQMMVNEANIPYYEDKVKGLQAIGLPYKNKQIYMYIVLPKLNLHLKNLTASLCCTDIEKIVKESKLAEVFYVIPKMKLDAEFNLKETLQRLNIREVFDPSKANFSNLASKSKGIYASDILHKVEMDINEIGTTASAATIITTNRGGYVNFRADRPFLFFIYNTAADVITFWGTIQKPTPYQ